MEKVNIFTASSQRSFKQTITVQIWSAHAYGVCIMLIATRCTVLSRGIDIYLCILHAFDIYHHQEKESKALEVQDMARYNEDDHQLVSWSAAPHC